MSMNIKKSVIFDPKNIVFQHRFQDEPQEQKTNRKTSQIQQLIFDQLDYQLQTKQPSTPPEIKIKKPQLPQPKIQPSIKISWAQDSAEEQTQFNRQIKLTLQIAQLVQQKLILQQKLIVHQKIITKLQNTLFVQKQQNHQLSQKIDAIINQNVAAEQFYQMEQSYIKMEGQLNQLNIQNHELRFQLDDLKQKQLQLERLLVQYESIKMRCQQFQLNTEKYKGQIAKMKQSLRDFENDFYNSSKKPQSKKGEREMEISLTQKKLQFMTAKLHEFEDNFNAKQLEAFENIKDGMIENYEKYLDDQVKKIQKNAEITQETQRQELIEQAKRRNQRELGCEVRGVEKKIDEYKARIREIKLAREKKSVRERVYDLQAKMTQLSHSQIITTMSLSMKQSGDTTRLKDKYGHKNQSQGVNNVRLISPATNSNGNSSQKVSNIVNQSTNLSKNSTLAQPSLKNSPVVSKIGIVSNSSKDFVSTPHINNQIQSNVSPANTRLSSISPPSNFGNLSSINQILNSKLSSINQPLNNNASRQSIINQPNQPGNISTINPLSKSGKLPILNAPPPVFLNQKTGRYEYENGVQIPTQGEFQFLQFESKSLKTQLVTYEGQLKDYQSENQKMNQKNDEIYKQAQAYKLKFQNLQNQVDKIKTSNSSVLTQLQKAHQNALKFLNLQIQALKKQNSRNSKLINIFEAQILKLKKSKQQLQRQIDCLKKLTTMTETAYQTKIAEINAQNASSIKGVSAISIRQQIQRKNIILEKQLQENLALTSQVEQQLETIKKHQKLISELTLSSKEKTQQIQTLTKNVHNLTFRIQKLVQEIKEKDTRVKKAEQNLSVQMSQKRAQMLSVKKESKKLVVKLEQMKEKLEQQMEKRDRRYRRLQQRIIGVEKTNQSMKDSLNLSRSLELNRIIEQKEDRRKGQYFDKLIRKETVMKQSQIF